MAFLYISSAKIMLDTNVNVNIHLHYSGKCVLGMLFPAFAPPVNALRRFL
jgi:hypothetical protein